MEFTDAKTAPPLKSPRQDIATFLLARGDYAWLGYGWQGCVGGNASVGGTDGKWPRPVRAHALLISFLLRDVLVFTNICFNNYADTFVHDSRCRRYWRRTTGNRLVSATR